MREITVQIFEIQKDGVPPKEDYENNIGRIAFLHDGSIYQGWELSADKSKALGANAGEIYWEASEDVVLDKFGGVTHWILFPESLTRLQMYKDSQ